MGLKDWLKGGNTDSIHPLKIQDLERIITKRQTDSGAITLIIGGNEYRLVAAEDYERIMKAVEAIEALGRRMSGD